MSNALIVVDAQNDFCEGGGLPVEGGREVADKIASHIMLTGYDFKLATKDWHNYGSDNHGHLSESPDYKDTWPAHCLSGSWGSNFRNPLNGEYFMEVFKKGRGLPAYSGFQGVGHRTSLLLEEYLRSNGITRLSVCGIATDYCVKATVLDALDKGFKVTVLSDLTVAVGDKFAALTEMEAAGAAIL